MSAPVTATTLRRVGGGHGRDRRRGCANLPELAEGATLIFAVSVHQAEEIARRIPGAAVVTEKRRTGPPSSRLSPPANSLHRQRDGFYGRDRHPPGGNNHHCQTDSVRFSVYPDGGPRTSDLPRKKRLNLIDCVGVTGKASLCTAPSLLGIDLSSVPARKADEVQGMLFDLPIKATAAADCPESWIKNVQIVDLWGRSRNTGRMMLTVSGCRREIWSAPFRKNSALQYAVLTSWGGQSLTVAPC